MILDCTLRDGGYINENNFGEKNIKKLIKYLKSAKVDIIECGYLMDNIEYDKNKTEIMKLKVSEFKSHTIHYGYVMDGNIVVDEVMVSFMKAFAQEHKQNIMIPKENSLSVEFENKDIFGMGELN